MFTQQRWPGVAETEELLTMSRSKAALKRYLVNVASPLMVNLAAVSQSSQPVLF